MRTDMRQYLADVHRIETFPLGCDDPELPEELLWSAQVMRTYRDLDPAKLDAFQRDRVVKLMRPYLSGEIAKIRPQVDDRGARVRSRAP